MAYDPKIPEEEDDMNDDSIKWAVVFIIIGVETAVGLLFQVRLELLVLLVMLLILYEVLWCVVSPRAQNRDNQKSNSMKKKLMSSHMSPRASHSRHQYPILANSPGSSYRRLFSYIGPYKYKTSAFVTGKCRFKVKSAGGTCQDGVKMAH